MYKAARKAHLRWFESQPIMELDPDSQVGSRCLLLRRRLLQCPLRLGRRHRGNTPAAAHLDQQFGEVRVVDR